jgi:predicted AAA+ superfamily ATPase
MIKRPFWLKRIEDSWKKRPIVWLAGVRRVGKTTLARMLPETLYLNCDLPTVADRFADPEFVFRSAPESVIVLDEIHRLADPSQILKIAADAFPKIQILATGSSTLAATKKFRDSLTGRKTILRLPPVLWTECREEFGISDLDRRLLHGGLPEFLLSPAKDDSLYAEWMDSFYARDIQELFAVRQRTGFLALLRLMMRQSGGLADYSALSRECDLSRPTVKAYLEAMSAACAVIAVPPYHGGGRRELVRRPKIYGFDTGFVSFVRGWKDIREEDRGLLWEHLILDILREAVGPDNVFYWRDKSGAEVDFVVRRGETVDAIECKINPGRFNPRSLAAFRNLYPKGRNFVVGPGIVDPHVRKAGGLEIQVVGGADLIKDFQV